MEIYLRDDLIPPHFFLYYCRAIKVFTIIDKTSGGEETPVVVCVSLMNLISLLLCNTRAANMLIAHYYSGSTRRKSKC